MADGSLSQSEIDALLKGTDDRDKIIEEALKKPLTEDEFDSIVRREKKYPEKSAADELASLADLAGIDPAMDEALSKSLGPKRTQGVEILSQDEIDTLLSAISDSQESTEDYMGYGSGPRVKIYDFKRPDKFTKNNIRTLQTMHETWSRLTTVMLSAQLQTEVQIHVASVDQLTYEEFIRSIPNPTTLAIINMDPLKGSAALEIDPQIIYAMISLLFGGDGKHKVKNREMTDIEISVMEGVIVRLLGNLRESWSRIIDLRPRLGVIETNPMFAQIVPPNDMIVLITFETKIGDVEGMMNLCIPYVTIEPIIMKLDDRYGRYGADESQTNEDELQVEITLAHKDIYISLEDFLSLKVGDTLPIPKEQVINDALGLPLAEIDGDLGSYRVISKPDTTVHKDAEEDY